jgi:2,4-dienoyl-CoA reductase (NADPH2)
MNPSGKISRLLEPLQVKGVTLRNRIVKPPQVLGFAADDGNASPMLIGHYEAIAKGGVGLLIVESTCVDYPIGGKGENRLRIDEDAFIPSFSRLAETIHGNGCPTFLQLTHNGPAGHFSGFQPLAASALSAEDSLLSDPRGKYDPPRAMTIADIEHTVEKHAEAAWRAKQAGFDGVEVHAGHSYLLNSFLSRAWNRRDDDYGCQTLETRARFAAEIVRAIRTRVGPDFVIGMRINGEEWGHKQGTTPQESRGVARILEVAGLDIIHVTGWGYGNGAYSWMLFPEQLLYPEPTVSLAKLVRTSGVFASSAAGIKAAVSIPVITVGSLGPELGEWILRKGMADAIAMGRRLMADPDLPRKLVEGRPEDIRPCMACLECMKPMQRYRPTSCRVNAALGKEREYRIEPAARRKRVVVIGGGPGGMEAARVAAARGHEVVLYDKAPQLGGSLPLAALIKGTLIEDLPALVTYFETQLRKQGVRIQLGQEFTLETARAVKPDAVVVAIGGQPTTLTIPGIDRRNVLTGHALERQADPYLRLFGPRILGWITRFWLPVGKRVVVIGGLLHGCQVAAFLVKSGRQVTIIESSDDPAAGMPVAMKRRLLDWLAQKGAAILTEAECEEITAEGVVVRTKEGTVRTVIADTVLTALPPRPNPALAKALEGVVPEVHSIGDCGESHLILQAIADGSRVGHSV